MNVTLAGSSLYAAASRRKSYFDHGGGFEKISGNRNSYARQFSRNLAGALTPHAAFKKMGGPAANLHRAFATRRGNSIDVTA